MATGDLAVLAAAGAVGAAATCAAVWVTVQLATRWAADAVERRRGRRGVGGCACCARTLQGWLASGGVAKAAAGLDAAVDDALAVVADGDARMPAAVSWEDAETVRFARPSASVLAAWVEGGVILPADAEATR